MHWEPILKLSKDADEWYAKFVSLSGRWLSSIPSTILTFWIEILQSHVQSVNQFIWNMGSAFRDDFSSWHAPELQTLFAAMLQLDGEWRHTLIKIVARWVKQTNSGDEILWQFMIKKSNKSTKSSFDLQNMIEGFQSGEVQESLFHERIIKSESLLNLVLNFLIQQSIANSIDWEGGFQDNLLRYGDWELTHSSYDTRPYSDLHHLMSALGQALCHHASNDTVWWRQHEPDLRSCQEMGVRYLLLKAYETNIPVNIVGITSQVTDAHFLRYSRLKYEIGQLLNQAAPYLPGDVLDGYEDAISSLYHDAGQDEAWVKRIKLEYLSWIPGYLRSEQLIERIGVKKFPYEPQRPAPDILRWGGMVVSPITCQEMRSLSINGIIKLLQHYSEKSLSEFNEGKGLIGGLYQISSTLTQASTNDPLRFLAHLRELQLHNINEDYRDAVIRGISYHLQHRFGNLQKPEY